ncbi:MAG: hypothetical protein L6R38_006150 [Xanthoria sp. 2 TBL-2021]|nr:MAG: hypothetical protein L6R38_006150 [Xanthoria sp. 2 TBL-2021]
MPSIGFELFGLIGSVKATADIIDSAIQTLKDYHNSDDDFKKLRFALRADSIPLRAFIKILTVISASGEDTHISEEDGELHMDIALHLKSLEERLRERLLKLEVDPGGLASRSAWALWRKKDLEKLLKELGDWIRRAWVIYAAIDAESKSNRAVTGQQSSEERMGNLVELFSRLSVRPVHSRALSKPFNDLKAQGEPSRRFAVTSSGTHQVGDVRLIFEYMYKPYSDNLAADEIDMIGSATRDLASVLYHSNPEQTRILKCHGYCHDPRTRRFGLLYELPPSKIWAVNAAGHARVLSLREYLNRTPHYPLNHKLSLCCNIAQAVLYVHLVGWVHKSIRPDNILIFENETSDESDHDYGAQNDEDARRRREFPFTLNGAYLAGFEYARSIKALSDRTSDAEWRVNIYRHPKRQHLIQNEEYTMAHDIYSLGVVLLEVGLWGSNGFTPFQKREAIFKNIAPDEVKTVLLDIARGTKMDGVAVFLGERFADLVAFCLNIEEKQEVATAAFVQEIWLKLDGIRSSL